MNESRFEIIVGAIVLLIAGGFLYYLVPSDMVNRKNHHMSLMASFSSVQGVNVGTDVKMAGIKIGSVTSLELNKETFAADLELSIQSGVQIPEDSSAAIEAESLLGEYFVEIIPGGSFVNLQTGEKITDTQGSVGLTQLLIDFFFAVK